MRQEGDNCGKSKAGPFWRRRAGFLFQTNRFSRTLITDPRSVLSVIVRGCLINAFFVDGRCMNGRPDAIPFMLFRAHLDEPALTVIRAAVNRGQPLGANHFKEQVAAALGRRALARKQGRQREVVAAQLPGKMGLDLSEERMRRKEIHSATFNSRKAYLDTFWRIDCRVNYYGRVLIRSGF